MCAFFSRKLPAVDVLVVGAGPVGMFTALRLAQKGVSVAIAEQAHSPATHSYALALHPETVRLLEESGLQDITRSTRLLPRIAFYDDERERAALSLGDSAHPDAALAVIGQDVLETRLAAALERARVPILWGRRVSVVRQDQEGVSVDIQRLGQQGHAYAVTHTVSVVESTDNTKVRFVIGADGHGSIVRSQQGIEFREMAPADIYAVAELETSMQLPDEARVVITHDSTNVLWPLPGKRCRWSLQIPNGSAPYYSRMKERGVFDRGDDWNVVLSHDSIAELLCERAPWFTDSLDGLRWRKLVRFEKRLAACMGRGRVWLAGDAAHMGWPIGVQSMNTGLMEGNRVANAIDESLHNHSLNAFDSLSHDFSTGWELMTKGTLHLRGMAGADPWVMEHSDRIFHSLPGTPDTLVALLARMGLDARTVVPIV